VSAVGFGGFIPFPGYNFFRNDLWFYDLNSSTWNEVTIPDGVIPDGRVDPVFLLLGDVLFLHGVNHNWHNLSIFIIKMLLYSFFHRWFCG